MACQSNSLLPDWTFANQMNVVVSLSKQHWKPTNNRTIIPQQASISPRIAAMACGHWFSALLLGQTRFTKNDSLGARIFEYVSKSAAFDRLATKINAEEIWEINRWPKASSIKPLAPSEVGSVDHLASIESWVASILFSSSHSYLFLDVRWICLNWMSIMWPTDSSSQLYLTTPF